MGSKNKIKNYILPIILEDKEKYEYYIEPFCGSLAVIEQVQGIKKVACDINPFLIAMWKCLKHFEYDKNTKMDFLQYLIEVTGIVTLEEKEGYLNKEYFITKEKYDYWRNEYKQYKHKVYNDNFLTHFATIGFVGFMGSFNGRFYDGGYSGKTKTRNYIDEQIRNTLSQLDTLHDITFQCGDYVDLFDRIAAYEKPCIIYCDPPYSNTKQYDLSKNFNYNKFYVFCSWMAELGHKVIISEYDMPFPQFKPIWEMEVTNSMNTTKTYKPVEKLFIPNPDNYKELI
jgi:DNA adenine methylase